MNTTIINPWRTCTARLQYLSHVCVYLFVFYQYMHLDYSDTKKAFIKLISLKLLQSKPVASLLS